MNVPGFYFCVPPPPFGVQNEQSQKAPISLTMHVCMYIRMLYLYVCVYVCMSVCMHVRTYVSSYKTTELYRIRHCKIFLKSVDTIRFQLKPNNNNTFCTKRYTHVLWTSLSHYSLYTHNLYNGAKTVSNKYRTLCPINVFGKILLFEKIKRWANKREQLRCECISQLHCAFLTHLSLLLYRVPIFLCSLPPFLSFFIFLKLQSSFFFAFI